MRDGHIFKDRMTVKFRLDGEKLCRINNVITKASENVACLEAKSNSGLNISMEKLNGNQTGIGVKCH